MLVVQSNQRKGRVRVGAWGLLLALLLLLLGSSAYSCSGSDEPTGEPKLILTAFRQQGFGTGQVPILVVAQIRGTLSHTHCVFFEMQYADANSIRLYFFDGEEIPQDHSEFTAESHGQCLQYNTSCLFGQISRKKNEFTLQADLTGRTGGLLVASLYDRDCKKRTGRLGLQTLAIGNSMFRSESARSNGEGADPDAGPAE